MTLPLNSRLSALYDTNGTQKDFSFGFRVFFDPDNGGYGLEVRRQTADGYEIIPKSDYLVLPVEDNSAGIVRFSIAPSAGQQIYIAGKTPTIQQLVLTNFGRYSAESIETQFDFITAIIQEWLSALGEETRQRIAADNILTQYVVQRIDDFVQQVNQNWDDKSQEIEDYINTIMPSFTQTLREEIEAFAVAGMQDAIDQTLADSKAEIDDAVARANAAALAAAITGKVYDSPEAGVDPVTGVANGAYFNVRSPSDDSYLDEYQNVGGVATATGKSYPSSSALANIQHNNLKDRDVSGAHPASAITDSSGKDQQQINDETPRFLDLAALTGANLVGYSPQELYDINTVGGALNVSVGNRIYLMSYIPKAEHASILNGTSTYDASAAIASALADTIAKNATLVLPDGQVSFSSFPNVKTARFKMVGQGSSKTKLKYTGTGTAVSFDAFASGSPTDPFLDGYSVGGFHIVGDILTTGLFAQGIARSFFSDIMVNGSNMLDGTAAFKFAGVMLSLFNNLKTSYPYGNTPYRGLQLTAGTRASVSVGACSNNVFIGCYAEGNSIGWQLASNGADQNTFIGGSPEACKVYGLVVGTSCRYNTFIGVGAENSAESVTADISDGGIYSRYTGCYSAKSVRIGSNSRGIRIESGYFERIEIQANARAAVIDQVTVNNWNTGNGGLVDLGFDTAASRVTDAQTGEFIYVRKARFSVTVGASPFLWENTHQVPVKVRVQGGTVTNAQIRRGADSWTEPNPAAAGGGTANVGIYLLMPGDKLETSYSAAPAISVAVMPM